MSVLTGRDRAESSSGAAAGPSAPPEDEGVEPVDPEFLAALPEELQQEVLESRRREIQQRRSAREREEAQRVRAAHMHRDSHSAKLGAEIRHLPLPNSAQQNDVTKSLDSGATGESGGRCNQPA